MFLTRNKKSYNTYYYIRPDQLYFLTFECMEVGNAKVSSTLPKITQLVNTFSTQ